MPNSFHDIYIYRCIYYKRTASIVLITGTYQHKTGRCNTQAKVQSKSIEIAIKRSNKATRDVNIPPMRKTTRPPKIPAKQLNSQPIESYRKHARKACWGDSLSSSRAKLRIHSIQSSSVLLCDVSHASLRLFKSISCRKASLLCA